MPFFEAGKVKALGLAISLAAAVMILGACGSAGGEDATAAVGGLSPGTADRLAGMSDEIAAALDAGDVCGAAARADDLQAAVSEAKIPAELRSEVEAGADQLVNEVNCDSTEPETTTTNEEEQDHAKERKEEGDPGSDSESNQGGPSGVPPGHGGTPPGQAGKIKGGI